jgi:CSLREA domain-containing protein
MRTALTSFAAAWLLFAADPIGAATFTVSKTADTNDGVCDADCSLREAVAAAAASPSDDVIVFDAAVFGTPQTITLSGSEIAITANGRLVIEGPGAHLLTLDGNNASRIISNNVGAVTSIRNLRFTGGNGVGAVNSGRGGAIYNNGGDLLLERIVVEGNSATVGGGLNNANTAILTVVDSLISGNNASSSGGGIQNFSTSVLTLVGCTFAGNTGNSLVGGGAGQLNGTVVIANSTFSGNAAPAGSGGGISSNGASLLIVNSTFAGNSALDNAGGLHRAIANTNVLLRNSIFSGNTTTNGASPDVTANDAVTSLGNNLVGEAGPTSGWIASDLLNQNPLLGGLADNEGPTPTHRLLDGSPAIDAGQNCVVNQSCASNNLAFDLDFDQRGLPRPSDAAVDIGAYEAQIADSLIFADGFEGP